LKYYMTNDVITCLKLRMVKSQIPCIFDTNELTKSVTEVETEKRLLKIQQKIKKIKPSQYN
jgi:hypothetical protein